MAAVITLQSSSTTGPTGPSAASFQQSPSSDHQLLRPRIPQSSQAQQTPAPQPGSLSTPHSPVSSVGTLPRVTAPGRDGSSCDACVRRKSRCAMNEMVNKCYSCDFHRQDCTFTLAVASRPGTADLQAKKRKLDETESEELGSPKRYDFTGHGRSRTWTRDIVGLSANQHPRRQVIYPSPGAGQIRPCPPTLESHPPSPPT